MISIDLEKRVVTVRAGGLDATYPFASGEAFAAVSEAWLQCGWDSKYVYGFTWLGRPVIQLPEDMLRLQEVVYRVKPDVIVETGVAHGGSLMFHASIAKAIGRGRVIGIDIEIRPHNRRAIEAHELSEYITLIEGSSTSSDVVAHARSLIAPGETVLVVLDSLHTKEHVLGELNAYAPVVSVGSYVVVEDGIMERLVGAPRAGKDWAKNNPRVAIDEFLQRHPDFVAEEPTFPFNEGMVRERVSYWPKAYLLRTRVSAGGDDEEAPGLLQ
jgi:cephalosporin hydroxylase